MTPTSGTSTATGGSTAARGTVGGEGAASPAPAPATGSAPGTGSSENGSSGKGSSGNESAGDDSTGPGKTPGPGAADAARAGLVQFDAVPHAARDVPVTALRRLAHTGVSRADAIPAATAPGHAASRGTPSTSTPSTATPSTSTAPTGTAPTGTAPTGTAPTGTATPAQVQAADIDVERAAALLAGVARRTRVVASPRLTSRLGVPVWLKCEHEQHTGSFKLRGAYIAAALGDPEARARGIVAASAGNHAQGAAFAAARFGVPAQIFVPAGANPVKVARTRRWGARVSHVPGGIAAALAAADEYAAKGGRLLVHPFDDARVISGQATVGLELLEQVPGLATVLVGVGGGGLVTGLATAIKRHRPEVRIIGVQAEGAPSFARSWHAGRLVEGPTATIADGMSVARAGTLTLGLAASLLDDVVTVEEEAFWAAMATLLREDGQVVEPAGAAGVAALLTHPELAQGPTAVILSGGNIDPDTARAVEALAARPLIAAS